MASIFITDVDDFLGTSQACVNPLFTAHVSNVLGLDDVDGKQNNPKNSQLDSPQKHEGTKATTSRQVVGRRLGQSNRKRILLSSSETSLNEDMGNAMVSSRASSFEAVTNEEKATVSVADCLACSGCVTSAEAVLVNNHSLATLRKNCRGHSGTYDSSLDEAKRNIVLTISPAVIADLTRLFYLDREITHHEDEPTNNCDEMSEWAAQVFGKIVNFLHLQLGADLIIDGQIVGDLSLLESAHEFVHRYRTTASRASSPITPSPRSSDNVVVLPIIKQKSINTSTTPSIAVSATETRYIITKDDGVTSSTPTTGTAVIHHEPGRANSNSLLVADDHFNILPMLASSCPGFVCFVEKTAPHCIPSLTTAKSAMSIGGYLAKHVFSPPIISKDKTDTATETSSSLSYWYHVAIMPCHDKKLEASRKDLAWEQIMTKSPVPDVDLVITTSELLDLIQDVGSATLIQQNQLMNKNGTVEEETLFNIASYFVSLPSAAIIPRASVNNIESTTDLKSDSASIDSLLTIFQTGERTQNNNQTQKEKTIFSVLANTHATGTALSWNAPTKTVSSGSSGSFADFIFRAAALELFGFEIPADEALPWKNVTRINRAPSSSEENISTYQQQQLIRSRRNNTSTNMISDFRELILFKSNVDETYSLNSLKCDSVEDHNNNLIPVLKFATAYGLKTIQGIVQKMKDSGSIKTRSSSAIAKKNGGYCDYHYIEVMACPSGCLNGGGQVGKLDNAGSISNHNLRLKKEAPIEKRDRLWKNHKVLNSGTVRSPLENPLVCSLFPFLRSPTHSHRSDKESKSTTEAASVESIQDAPYCPPQPPFISGPFSSESQRVLHTRFHAVPKLQLSFGAVSGVAVSDTKW